MVGTLLLVCIVCLSVSCGRSSGGKSVSSSQNQSGAARAMHRIIYGNKNWEAQAARRTVLGFRCLQPCAALASVAAGRLGRDEHGGHGYLAIKPSSCLLPGLDAGFAKCTATCDRANRLGSLSIEYPVQTARRWRTHCQAVVARYGPPDEGSCTKRGDVQWLATPTSPRIDVDPGGSVTLDCGLPSVAYSGPPSARVPARRRATPDTARPPVVPSNMSAKPPREGLTRRAIQAVFRRGAKALQRCYTKTLRPMPRLTNDIAVEITVTPQGKVSATKVTKSTFADKTVGSCITREIQSWSFPPTSTGKPVVIRYPIHFRPSD